ncbi:hypothetical protein MTO96_002684 [Rhipicephalus appendiculatus]
MRPMGETRDLFMIGTNLQRRFGVATRAAADGKARKRERPPPRLRFNHTHLNNFMMLPRRPRCKRRGTDVGGSIQSAFGVDVAEGYRGIKKRSPLFVPRRQPAVDFSGIDFHSLPEPSFAEPWSEEARAAASQMTSQVHPWRSHPFLRVSRLLTDDADLCFVFHDVAAATPVPGNAAALQNSVLCGKRSYRGCDRNDASGTPREFCGSTGPPRKLEKEGASVPAS